MTAVFWIYVATGAFFILVGFPLAARRIPPNGWYGFRTRKTLKPGNAHIWYDANAYQGRLFQWAGAIVIGATGLLWYVPGFTEDSYAIACVSVMMVSLLWVVIAGFIYLARLK